jgi:hypothetical protein
MAGMTQAEVVELTVLGARSRFGPATCTDRWGMIVARVVAPALPDVRSDRRLAGATCPVECVQGRRATRVTPRGCGPAARDSEAAAGRPEVDPPEPRRTPAPPRRSNRADRTDGQGQRVVGLPAHPGRAAQARPPGCGLGDPRDPQASADPAGATAGRGQPPGRHPPGPPGVHRAPRTCRDQGTRSPNCPASSRKAAAGAGCSAAQGGNLDRARRPRGVFERIRWTAKMLDVPGPSARNGGFWTRVQAAKTVADDNWSVAIRIRIAGPRSGPVALSLFSWTASTSPASLRLTAGIRRLGHLFD